jgi:hypothetical protein
MFTKTDIERYFTAEKMSGTILMVMAAVFMLAAVYLLLGQRSAFYKGLSIPLILFSVIFLYRGYSVYSTADESRVRNVYAYDMDPGRIKEKELPGLRKSLEQTKRGMWIEVAVFITGIFMWLYFRDPSARTFLQGIGIALALSAFLSYGIDFAGKNRTSEYLKKAGSFIGSGN